jgi:hypothetical protein
MMLLERLERLVGANAVAAPLERDAPSKLGVFQALDAGKALIDQDGIGQRTEVFSGLELGLAYPPA